MSNKAKVQQQGKPLRNIDSALQGQITGQAWAHYLYSMARSAAKYSHAWRGERKDGLVKKTEQSGLTQNGNYISSIVPVLI